MEGPQMSRIAQMGERVVLSSGGWIRSVTSVTSVVVIAGICLARGCGGSGAARWVDRSAPA